MAQHSKTEWFQVQALRCIGLALRAKDPRIKRLYALEAERWLRLTELKGDASSEVAAQPNTEVLSGE